MNFLGHCLFSSPTPEALAGSLWPDFAKRPNSDQLSPDFYRHFDQHQLIDKITDTHSLLEPVRVGLRPTFRKTTPIILDMMLDHHLAKHWLNYHVDALDDFAEHSYQALHRFEFEGMPERFERTRYWMSEHNWFVSYRTQRGMFQALEGMARRIRFNNPIVDNRQFAIDATIEFATELDAFIKHLKLQIG